MKLFGTDFHLEGKLKTVVVCSSIALVLATNAIAISKDLNVVSLYKKFWEKENKFHHVAEYCPNNWILGKQHQVDRINELSSFHSYLDENNDIVVERDAIKEEIDGKTIYRAPFDYELKGDKAVKILKHR